MKQWDRMAGALCWFEANEAALEHVMCRHMRRVPAVEGLRYWLAVLVGCCHDVEN